MWMYRNDDVNRVNQTLFEEEYFRKSHRMVFVEGPLPLNSRLTDQQGVFLLPGIVSETTDSILNHQLDSENVLSIIEVKLDKNEFAKVFTKLHRMRITYRMIYADSTLHGHDLVMKIPTLLFRTERIFGAKG
ncbi:MAG TPA: hypothetical protein VK616_13580 [Flavitalea sp.]|nr:hypothetical protein [Flavitalea sp.]